MPHRSIASTSMNTSPEFGVINCCNSKLRSNSLDTQYACPPRCYCDKRNAYRNNEITPVKKQTASAIVTKMDISPCFYEKRERGGSRIEILEEDTISQQTQMYHPNGTFPSCGNSQKTPPSLSSRCLRDKHSTDNIMEPTKLPKKASCPKNESIKDRYTLLRSNSSSSLYSSSPFEPSTVFVSNKGVQYEDTSTTKQNYISQDPLNNIQYLIMNMKSKLKDDPDLEYMLNKMEVEIARVPFDRGDSNAMSGMYKRESFDKYIFPKNNHHETVTQKTYEGLRKLEAACAKLKMERDLALEEVARKEAELLESLQREEESKSKLIETNSQIKEISAKLETYTKSMEGLTERIKRLQQENRETERIRDQVSKLSCMLCDVTQENRSLLSELQLVSIKRNKLQVELAVTEQDLEKKTKELRKMPKLMDHSKKLKKNKDFARNRPVLIEELEDPETALSGSESGDAFGIAHSLNCSTQPPCNMQRKSQVSTNSNTSADVYKQYKNEVPKVLEQEHNTKKESVSMEMNTCCHKNKSHSDNEQITLQHTQVSLNREENHIDFGKIEKLKNEIRRMFTEMRDLAQDVPLAPPAEFSSVDDTEDIQCSDKGSTDFSFESISDLHSTDIKELLGVHKIKY